MKLNNLKYSILIFLFIPFLLGAQEFTLDFSQPTIDCNATTVCYDVTLAANGPDFGLGSYNLRLFYDASRIAYVTNSPNTNNLPSVYAITSIMDDSDDLTTFGSLAFESTLGFLEIGVDYTPSTPEQITSAPGNILQNLCFAVLDATILSDNASCFDLIWVNETTNEDYTNSVTTLNNADTGNTTASLLTSTYNPLTSASNCLVDACVMDACMPIVDADGDGVCDVGSMSDPDPNDPCVPDAASAACVAASTVFELDFTAGELNCDTQVICYDITIEAPVDFDLGAYNLRLYYDADILDLIDASPNLSTGTTLSTSYNISSINDMQGGDMTGNGSLPFEDNIDIADIAVDYLGSNPIVATTTPQIITHDLCFNIVDPALIDDPVVCIHAVWVTNATEEGYTVGETTVNVAGGVGMTTDIDNSIYNDLDPTGDQCLVGACTDPTIPTMGEWGLISLALILLIFGVVAIKGTHNVIERSAVNK